MVTAWRDGPGVAEARLNEAVRRLVAALQPERIYLFGSRARGDFDADSDWDLLVVVPESPESHRQLAQIAYAAVSGAHIPMDIIVWKRAHFEWMAPAKASLPATVLREGRLLCAA